MLRGDVIYASASFLVGDKVYVAFRSKDGAQYVIAEAIVCCDVDHRSCKGYRTRSSTVAIDDRNDGQRVVIRASDLQLLWPSKEA